MNSLRQFLLRISQCPQNHHEVFIGQDSGGNTSALATSSGDLIHSTVPPSFSMALTRERTFPAT